MIIDYRNVNSLDSFLLVEDALDKVIKGQKIKILVNHSFTKEQIEEFLILQRISYKIEMEDDHEVIIIDKLYDVSKLEDEIKKITLNKILYLNSDFIGTGTNGKNLLTYFLESFSKALKKPKYIILVNDAVKISTSKGHFAYQALKALEKDIEILSSQNCLEYYNLLDKLTIGRAVKIDEITRYLIEYETIKL